MELIVLLWSHVRCFNALMGDDESAGLSAYFCICLQLYFEQLILLSSCVCRLVPNLLLGEV